MRDRWDRWKMEHLAVENREDGYCELLANIRRLTVMVLDDLEEGSRLRTLDQGQKRLLSATGTRLLRLWRLALRDGGSRRVVEEARRIAAMEECGRLSMDQSGGLEERMRDRMIQELRQNLAKCRKVILDENLDLKTRERWTQLYNNTSQILNQLLKDRQMRDWENRLREIEKYRGLPGRTGAH